MSDIMDSIRSTMEDASSGLEDMMDELLDGEDEDTIDGIHSTVYGDETMSDDISEIDPDTADNESGITEENTMRYDDALEDLLMECEDDPYGTCGHDGDDDGPTMAEVSDTDEEPGDPDEDEIDQPDPDPTVTRDELHPEEETTESLMDLLGIKHMSRAKREKATMEATLMSLLESCDDGCEHAGDGHLVDEFEEDTPDSVSTGGDPNGALKDLLNDDEDDEDPLGDECGMCDDEGSFESTLLALLESDEGDDKDKDKDEDDDDDSDEDDDDDDKSKKKSKSDDDEDDSEDDDDDAEESLFDIYGLI